VGSSTTTTEGAPSESVDEEDVVSEDEGGGDGGLLTESRWSLWFRTSCIFNATDAHSPTNAKQANETQLLVKSP